MARNQRRGSRFHAFGHRHDSRTRRGGITVLAAVAIVLMLIMVAFAVDLGMICVAKAELQRTADASALAATEELLYQVSHRNELTPLQGGNSLQRQLENAAVGETAQTFARLNAVGQKEPSLQSNPSNNHEGEIVIGTMVRDAKGRADLAHKDPDQYNSVRVRVKRTSDRGGQVSLFFGNLLGISGTNAEAEAQAMFINEFKGFRAPEGPGDPPPAIMVFPFAVERDAWEAAQQGVGTDNYGWDKENERVTQQGDGIPEVNLYPLSTGAGGNFGTVDIGSNNSNTGTLRRQIVDGVTAEDLEFHGGELALNESGKLYLSGDPGLKAGPVQSAVQQIIGAPRIILLYDSVSDNGQNATFTVTGFAGGRVVDVKLTGGTKYLRIQSAPMVTRGGIEGKGNGSSQIYSPVKLVY